MIDRLQVGISLIVAAFSPANLETARTGDMAASHHWKRTG
jgi:hypothetical protein